MKKSRFSEQQIAYILKQVDDGLRVEKICRKAGNFHGISVITCQIFAVCTQLVANNFRCVHGLVHRADEFLHIRVRY